MTVRRREFLGLAGAAAAAVGLPGAASAQPKRGSGQAAAEFTTLERTLGAGGVPLRSGQISDYFPVVSLPGEPHIVRAELAGGSRSRHRNRRSLVSFVHLTDQHVVDVQSTTRVEFTDRYADGECGGTPFPSAHRAHEAGSARIVDAMLRQIRAIGVSPVSGRPLRAAICTGDNTDNQQGNELRSFLDLMDGTAVTGRRVTPQSGAALAYEGVQRSGDRAYWHPDDLATSITQSDQYRLLFGFPDEPGWLEKALAPFDAVGAGMDWFTCYGNHDGLAQGNAPVLPAFRLIAEGVVKVVGPPEHATCNSLTDPTAALGQLTVPGMPALRVTADTGRQYATRKQWIEAHIESPGSPHGHGFTAQDNLDNNRAYYVRDVGGVRWIVLDTVNPGGYSEGSIGDKQLTWLSERLDEADANGLLVMLFSHHGLRSLDNPIQTPDPLIEEEGGNDLPRHNAAEVEAMVVGHPSVIAWVNGHTHENLIEPRAGTGAQSGKFWDIGTAAHIDWPSQARLIEVFDNRDGTLSIFTTMVDHADDEIATFARELMGNDPQLGFDTGTGKRADRNTELLIAHPFA